MPEESLAAFVSPRPDGLRFRPRDIPCAALLLAVTVVAAPAVAAEPALLGPPGSDGPVRVSLGFFLSDVNAVDERREAFEFEAILTLKWRDPRHAFDPDERGVRELAYQGSYQFFELFAGWWPQLVLANKSGAFDSQAALLRVAPDGRMTLVFEVHAVAEMPMQLRRFPFDRQDFLVRFEVLGYGKDRVVLVPDPSTSGVGADGVSIPRWELVDMKLTTRESDPVYANGSDGAFSQVVATLDMARRPGHMLQVVVLPVTILVVLTFSVFWMDRSSLGDRMDISFIGILTVVAYQLVVNDAMPGIPYFTLMSGFLLSTYLVLAAGVVLNLVVSKLDQSGRHERGDRLDRISRWAVPAGFLGINLLSAAYFLVTQ